MACPTGLLCLGTKVAPHLFFPCPGHVTLHRQGPGLTFFRTPGVFCGLQAAYGRSMTTPLDVLPGIGAPATHTLTGAGYPSRAGSPVFHGPKRRGCLGLHRLLLQYRAYRHPGLTKRWSSLVRGFQQLAVKGSVIGSRTRPKLTDTTQHPGGSARTSTGARGCPDIP